MTRGTAVLDDKGQVQRIVGAYQDVTDRKLAEIKVRQRDAILDAVRFTAEKFLSTGMSWEEGVPEVLKRLERAMAVSRVYVFENFTGEDGALYARKMNQWSAPGLPRSNPGLQVLCYPELGTGRWSEKLAWLAAIVESSDAAIVGETLDRRITSWNSGAELLCGYTANEAIGQSIEFLIPEEHHERAAANFSNILHGAEVPWFESERMRKDGSPVSVAVSR